MASEETGPPGLSRDGAALTERELRAIQEIAWQVALADPDYVERLSGLGSDEYGPHAMPSRWAALPVAMVGALLVIGVLFTTVVLDGAGERIDTSQAGIQGDRR
jgi:hypothetical protein